MNIVCCGKSINLLSIVNLPKSSCLDLLLVLGCHLKEKLLDIFVSNMKHATV